MNGVRIVCDTNPIIYLLDGNKDIAMNRIETFENSTNLSLVVVQGKRI